MSVNKIFSLSLDISQSISTEEFRVKQGDTGNVLIITLLDRGAAVHLSGCKIVALFSHGSTLTMQDNWSDNSGVSVGGTEHNVITIDLFNGSFSPGLNTCEIQVYSGEDLSTLVTSAQFNFRCDRSLLNEDTVISQQSYSILTSLIASVQGVINGAQSNWAESDNTRIGFIKNKPTSFTPAEHATYHASGGGDPITPTAIGAAAATHASSHGSSGADPVTPAAIGAAVIKTETVTLTTAGWTGDAAPYSQQLLVNSIPAACSIIACAAPGYEEAYGDAEIKGDRAGASQDYIPSAGQAAERGQRESFDSHLRRNIYHDFQLWERQRRCWVVKV